MKLRLEPNTVYLTCNDKLTEVRSFLNRFFDEKTDWSSHDGWVSFVMPVSGFILNIMDGSSQDMKKTQNVAIEISFESLEKLQIFAQNNNVKVQSFDTDKSEVLYKYHFCEIQGPDNICFIEGNYSSVAKDALCDEQRENHNKQFYKWSSKKKSIHTEKERPSFRVGEVWTSSLGVNIGFEQDGVGDESLRPILVLTKFNNEVFLGIPLSRNGKDGKYYYSFEFGDDISTALLSQVRLIDAKRLKYKLGAIAPKTRKIIADKIRSLIR